MLPPVALHGRLLIASHICRPAPPAGAEAAHPTAEQPLYTLEVCMTGLSPAKAAQFFRSEGYVSAQHTTRTSGIQALVPGAGEHAAWGGAERGELVVVCQARAAGQAVAEGEDMLGHALLQRRTGRRPILRGHGTSMYAAHPQPPSAFCAPPLPDIDDYVFEPCGYSMNGVEDAVFSTIHITPEVGVVGGRVHDCVEQSRAGWTASLSVASGVSAHAWRGCHRSAAQLAARPQLHTAHRRACSLSPPAGRLLLRLL